MEKIYLILFERIYSFYTKRYKDSEKTSVFMLLRICIFLTVLISFSYFDIMTFILLFFKINPKINNILTAFIGLFILGFNSYYILHKKKYLEIIEYVAKQTKQKRRFYGLLTCIYYI
jgi:hypothetical protein